MAYGTKYNMTVAGGTHEEPKFFITLSPKRPRLVNVPLLRRRAAFARLVLDDCDRPMRGKTIIEPAQALQAHEDRRLEHQQRV